MTAGLVGQSPITTFSSPVNGTSPIDANVVKGNDNTIKSAYNVHDADPTIHFQSSLNAARPAAGTLGRKWLDTDTLRVYYDTGSVWVEIGYLPASGGTVSGNVLITGTLGVTGATTLSSTLAVTGNATVGTAATSGVLIINGTVTSASAEIDFQSSGATKWQVGRGPGNGTDNFIVYNSVLAANAVSIASATSAMTVASTISLLGNTAAFPMLKRNGAGIDIRKADDSGYAGLNFGVSSVIGDMTLTGNIAATGFVSGAVGVYGGSAVASAVATGQFGDGTPLGSNDVAVANIPGVVTSIASASASGTIAVGNFAGKQTAASSGALDVLRGVVWAAHTSGTLAIGIGVHGTGQFDGNGGTTTSGDMMRAGNFVVGTGHTVTTLRSFHATTGSKTGTIGTQVGLDIDGLTLGTNNYAIRTQANDSLFNGSGSALATNATVGFVHLPNCAGTPTGVPANLVTGATPAVVDTTAGKLWAYYGAAWHFVTFT